MKLNDLTIKKEKELSELLKPNKIKKEINDGGIRICVLQRGWVVVGRFSQLESECRLTDASVIRTWGTTRGLGEIALNGPIKNKTILDHCPDVIFHELVGVFQLICEQDKWEKELR